MFKRIILACLVVTLLLVVSPCPVTAAEVPAAQTLANTVAAGNGYYLVVKADGSLWAQGGNWRGQLGVSSVPVGGEAHTPVKVMDNVSQVVVEGWRSLAIKTDGSLWAWGDNQFGVIGDGTVSTYHYDRNNEWVKKEDNDKPKPVKIMDNVVSVVAGYYHSLAVKQDGSLWAWGDNQLGQIGDGTVTTYHYDRNNEWVKKEDNDKYRPVKIMDDVVFITAGGNYSMAVKEDGSLWAWGSNFSGQLGDGTTIDRYAPVKIMDDVAFAAAGSSHSLAIKTDGSLLAWGNNQFGQLGDGTVTTLNKDGYVAKDNSKLLPVEIMETAAFAAAGNSYSLAIQTDGSLWSWGDNTFGQLGNGQVTVHDPENWDVIIMDNNRLNPIKIMDRVAFASLECEYNLIVKTDGSLWDWGNSWSYRRNTMGVPQKIMDGVKLPMSVVTTPPPIPEPPIPEPPISEPPISELPIPEPPSETTGFFDVPTNHWAYANIMALVEKGVISGYADGSFRPNAPVSRSELAKMMTLALQMPLLTNPTPSFVDVGENDWELVYVETAKRYLTGYQQGESYYFKGNEPATREDMAVALVKALELDQGAEDEINADYVYPKLRQLFNDADLVSPNLRKYVLTAYEFDLISGYPDGTFGPQKPITRAEAASLLIKVLKSEVSEVMEKVTFK